MDIASICYKLKAAQKKLASSSCKDINTALSYVKDSIQKSRDTILVSNAIDVEKATQNNMPCALIERLALDNKKLDNMLSSLDTVIALSSPVGEVVSGYTTDKGLVLKQVRVPLGVVAIIYESRPNVTLDAFALAFKSGNAILLRGSSNALNSNIALEASIKAGLMQSDIGSFAQDTLYLLQSQAHSDIDCILNAQGLIDVVLPRGSSTLIDNVVSKSRIPVIQTGAGVCHTYIDKTANIDMALKIVENAKMQRPAACNACECVVVHKDIASKFLPLLDECFRDKVTVKADKESMQYMHCALPATQLDYGKEFLSLTVAIKCVSSLEEAVDFINAHSTKHSDCIVTMSLISAQFFCQNIDSSCVYVNASTRFTDGGEFGFGAELGISTQKLHARGPMGIKALTTTKYIANGGAGLIR